jgi:hypothetical protein
MGFFSSLFKGPESKKLKISQPIPHPGQNTIRPGDLKTLAMLRQEQAQEERARIAKRKATPVSSKIATSFDQLLDNAGRLVPDLSAPKQTHSGKNIHRDYSKPTWAKQGPPPRHDPGISLRPQRVGGSQPPKEAPRRPEPSKSVSRKDTAVAEASNVVAIRKGAARNVLASTNIRPNVKSVHGKIETVTKDLPALPKPARVRGAAPAALAPSPKCRVCRKANEYRTGVGICDRCHKLAFEGPLPPINFVSDDTQGLRKSPTKAERDRAKKQAQAKPKSDVATLFKSSPQKMQRSPNEPPPRNAALAKGMSSSPSNRVDRVEADKTKVSPSKNLPKSDKHKDKEPKRSEKSKGKSRAPVQEYHPSQDQSDIHPAFRTNATLFPPKGVAFEDYSPTFKVRPSPEGDDLYSLYQDYHPEHDRTLARSPSLYSLYQPAYTSQAADPMPAPLRTSGSKGHWDGKSKKAVGTSEYAHERVREVMGGYTKSHRTGESKRELTKERTRQALNELSEDHTPHSPYEPAKEGPRFVKGGNAIRASVFGIPSNPWEDEKKKRSVVASWYTDIYDLGTDEDIPEMPRVPSALLPEAVDYKMGMRKGEKVGVAR